MKFEKKLKTVNKKKKSWILVQKIFIHYQTRSETFDLVCDHSLTCPCKSDKQKAKKTKSAQWIQSIHKAWDLHHANMDYKQQYYDKHTS
jgi:hypothetical protein